MAYNSLLLDLESPRKKPKDKSGKKCRALIKTDDILSQLIVGWLCQGVGHNLANFLWLSQGLNLGIRSNGRIKTFEES